MHRSLFWVVLAVVLTPASVRATEVVPGVQLIPGAFAPGRQPDGNTVIFLSKEGLVVIDTGRHAEHTQKILEFARKSGSPIKAVMNTHWHLDHVSGNAALRKAFPDIRVHASSAIEGAMTGFLAGYRGQLEEMIEKTKDPEKTRDWKEEVARIDSGRLLFPDEVVTASGPRQIAGKTFDVFLEERSVTEGDIWLLDRPAGVLVAGDLVTLPVPFLDTACPARWRMALEHLSKTEWKILIPGHGPPMSRRDFETYRMAFGRLLDCTSSSRPDAECVDGWLRDAASLISTDDPKFARSLTEYYSGSVLRGSAERLRRLCGEGSPAPTRTAVHGPEVRR